jgi:ketosteroid isomerase-like protein
MTINVSRRIPVNAPDQPQLSRNDVWRGLVMKADNALPFVPAMTHCQVLERHDERSFTREIVFRGEKCRERVTLTPEQRVTFERLDGSVLGNIKNEIEDDADGLGLRFSFSLNLAGVPDGAPAEVEYGKTVEQDYLKAVDATLGAIRKMKLERSDLISRFYDIVDSMRLDDFKAMFTDDATVQFANYPTAEGPDAIAGAIGAFWSSIGGLKHDFVKRWDTAEESILEASIDYTRKDGKVVTLPCVTVLQPRDGKVKNLRIFIDTAPIYA